MIPRSGFSIPGFVRKPGINVAKIILLILSNSLLKSNPFIKNFLYTNDIGKRKGTKLK